MVHMIVQTIVQWTQARRIKKATSQHTVNVWVDNSLCFGGLKLEAIDLKRGIIKFSGQVEGRRYIGPFEESADFFLTLRKEKGFEPTLYTGRLRGWSFKKESITLFIE